MANRKLYALAAAVLFIAITTGCGDGLARVNGAVTLAGEPVSETDTQRCYVTLKQVPSGVVASGEVDRSGSFSLRAGSSNGMPPGEYAASVRVCEVTPPPEPGGYSSSRDISPARYSNSKTSGLSVTLVAGSNDVQLDLDAE